MPISDYVSPEVRRAALLGLIVASHYSWRLYVNATVPEPYLDEVFHVPQARAYWDGKWTEWNPKITTPPALYVFSYAVNLFRWVWDPSEYDLTAGELRLTNLILMYMLLVALYVWTAVTKREVNEASILHREYCFLCFPLLFFFSGLYYTDVLSTFTVVVTYTFWLAGSQAEGVSKAIFQSMHLIFGLVSFATRQTNIFWVAVFLGGLQIIETLKDVVGEGKIHDPPVSEAYFEDFPTTIISVVQHAQSILPQLVLTLWPQISLLASFAGFVAWNGGVVLGDKSNHVASLHATQLLYALPFAIFFSWPVLLPHLGSLAANPRLRLPRIALLFSFTIVALGLIHVNTVVHPFTLADNRHYPFYVFRYFILPSYRKYLLAPIYVICGWLCLLALGPASSAATARISTNETKALDGPRTITFARVDTVHVSFVLVLLVSTALSLITAPLVEPRYFIIPWLIWRLHVPELLESDTAKKETPKTDANKGKMRNNSTLHGVREMLGRNALSIELLWYLLVNFVTGYLFINQPFTWTQEPAKASAIYVVTSKYKVANSRTKWKHYFYKPFSKHLTMLILFPHRISVPTCV